MAADEAVIDRSLPPIRDAKGRWRMHGGQSPGAPKGNKNACGCSIAVSHPRLGIVNVRPRVWSARRQLFDLVILARESIL